ncbi:unnamed protein product [Durusdinium trenchii]|uniref:Uncharacterized protein n=1 Tax=Durusdinium trenchii TaxID=1381693 RepID=A0ABP0NQN6_9DINO
MSSRDSVAVNATADQTRTKTRDSERQEVIRDELSRISSELPSRGSSNGLRGTVRGLIAEELKSVLSKKSLTVQESPSSFVRECLELQPVRDAQGTRPTLSRSSLSLDSPPFAVKHGEFTRKIQYRRGVGGVLPKDPPSWPTDTSTAPLLPSKYRELSWWLWASTNPEYQIHPEVVELRHQYRWHKGAGPDTRIFMNPKDVGIV